jgi:hypothetical protein
MGSYMKGSGEVDMIVFFFLWVAGLAILGVVTEAFGTDSREPIEDTHIGDWTRRTI